MFKGHQIQVRLSLPKGISCWHATLDNLQAAPCAFLFTHRRLKVQWCRLFDEPCCNPADDYRKCPSCKALCDSLETEHKVRVVVAALPREW